MACKAVLRSMICIEPFRPVRAISCKSSAASSSCKFGANRARKLHAPSRALSCSYNEMSPSSSSSNQDDQGPPQEAVLKAISEVSKTEGRVGQTTNVVIGGTVADDSANEWLVLDKKVNSYPTVRGFTAIGTGGDDFVQAMVVAVESVIKQPIPESVNVVMATIQSHRREDVMKTYGRVKQKLSSRGKYVSVNIGPVRVVSSEQVQAVYNAMRRDDRMKYFL